MDKLVYGLFVTVLGMGTVFVALWALVYVLIGMEKLPFSKQGKKQFPVNKEIKNVEEEVIPVHAEEDDEDLIAAITAAIAAFMTDNADQTAQRFVVRTITRIPKNTPSWSNAGRQEQIMNRF